MSTDLDGLLSRLRNEPSHPGLAGLEDAVFSRIAALPQISSGTKLRMGMFAAFGAGLLGVASTGFTPATDASITLSPFGPSNPLAPSTLLTGTR
jgi:hypothetical protein